MIFSNNKNMMNLSETKKEEKKNEILPGKRRSSLLSANLSRQTFFMLLFLEAIILALVGYFFFIKGVNKELKMVRAELVDKKQEFDRLSVKLDNFSVINKLYEGLSEEKLEKVKEVLPAEANLPDLLVNLDTLIKNNGFSMEGVEFQIVDAKGQEVFSAKNPSTEQISNEQVAEATSAVKKEIKTINIALNIEGSSYGGLKNLISQLENNLRLFDVVNFGFAGESTSLKIELKAYYL
jgi:Tfp pilus assembly protein PilO